jgi:DNA-binding helix-hairpin-helix protein with protein kinase domain
MPNANAKFTSADGHTYRYESELGVGGQAVVWRVTRLPDGKAMALKLFTAAPTGSDRLRQEERLKRVCEVAQAIAESLPDAQVCFPRAIHNERGEFGVLMEVASGKALTDSSLLVNPLDQPEAYISQALRGILSSGVQYFHFLLAAFHLSRALGVVHSHGMTHCDLSLANVFIDPIDGRISLIDCDNLACGGYLPVKVAGTPGFRAPELIGSTQALPSPETDRYSLAVLVFYLALLRHPLIGNTGNNWNPSFKTEDEAFGAKAVFTDHPKVKANRFKGGLPFETLPSSLRNLFVHTFSAGLTTPAERPTARTWARELWQALECMTVCTRCSQRFFLTDSAATCVFCGSTNRRQRWQLCFSNGQQMLAEPGRKLYEHHIKGQEYVFNTPLGELKLKGGDLVAKNMSGNVWRLHLQNGTQLQCNTGYAFRFEGIAMIDFGTGRSARVQKV